MACPYVNFQWDTRGEIACFRISSHLLAPWATTFRPLRGLARHCKIARGTKVRGPAKQVALRLLSHGDIL